MKITYVSFLIIMSAALFADITWTKHTISSSYYGPSSVYAIDMQDEVIASIMVGYEGHRGWINYMAVLTKYQNRGFGGLLIERATVELNKLGCQKVNLQVREKNNKVIDFYKKQGFIDDHVISLGKRLDTKKS